MPKWLENAVFYQIYPQSFRDTNSDGIGDLNGIIEKLDYIAELGCNAVWINPCFLSPFCDAGYDVEDYCTVAPRYGTNEDMVRLFSAAHERGMHVLLDLVPGHTSYTHRWFRESMKAERNEFTDRYVWTDSIWESPSDMQWLRGISPRDGSAAVNFFSTQPALNYGFFRGNRPWMQSMDAEGPKATVEAMKNVMRFWLGLGCDGFRVDMAGSLVKNDNERSEGTVSLWRGFREMLDREFPEAAMISEWGEPDKSLAGGFHMDFLLHFGSSHYNDLFRCENPYFSADGKGSAAEFIAKYKENREKTNGGGLMCIPSGNHDMDRLARTLSTKQAKLAFAFILTMPGAPFIYYGDEIGMRYVEGLRSVEGGFGRTGSRSPMQWSRETNAGFSSAAPESLYIPIDPNPDRPTVEEQRADGESLYNTVKSLIALRGEHTALSATGEIEFLRDEGYPMVYRRFNDSEEIFVIINPSGESRTVDIGCKASVLAAVGCEAVAVEGKVNIPSEAALIASRLLEDRE